MKTIKIFGLAWVLILGVACNNASRQNNDTPPSPTAPAPAPDPVPSQPKADKTEDGDHTEIELNEGGVNYSKKKGSNETDVKIKTDSNSLRIKRRK